MKRLLNVLGFGEGTSSRLRLQLRSLVAACCVWAAQADLAYGADAEAAASGKSYGVPWLIIVVVVALGVFITLRPAGRAAEIKRDLRADL